MDNISYWAKRNLKAQRAAAKKTQAEIEKQLGKYYASSMERIIADFEGVYNKLIADIGAGQKPTPADLYKLEKYWQMQGQLQNELDKLGDKSTKLMQSQFTKQFQSIYDDMALPSAKVFSKIDRAAAEQMINTVWCADGKNWSSRVWGSLDDLRETLNENLIHCVAAGKKTTELKKLLQNRFDVAYFRADTVVRTETAHIQTQAAQKRYTDYGVKEVEMWADPDERTCEICGKLHKKRYPVNATMPVPAHPNCRCTIIPVVEEELLTKTAITAPQAEPKKAVAEPKAAETPKTAQKTPKDNLGFKVIEGEHSLTDDLQAVNPKYSTGNKLYTNNCGNCSATFEMRRRGYDVEAAGLDGMYVSDWRRLFKIDKLYTVSAARKAKVIPEMTENILKWGEGARGSVFVVWDGRKWGHYFNCEVINGEVKFIDGQDPSRDAAAFFGRAKPSSIKYYRTDNVAAGDSIKAACKNRG